MEFDGILSARHETSFSHACACPAVSCCALCEGGAYGRWEHGEGHIGAFEDFEAFFLCGFGGWLCRMWRVETPCGGFGGEGAYMVVDV